MCVKLRNVIQGTFGVTQTVSFAPPVIKLAPAPIVQGPKRC